MYVWEDNVHRRVRAQAHNPRGRGIRFSPGAAALAARGSSSESDGSNARVLGLTLFAPHYQPDYLALRVEEAEGTLEIAERVRLSCARLPVDYFDRVVPVEPLPDPGFGAYLAYTSLLEYNAMAAVVIDMRPVGGLRFATVLPTRLSYDALDQFLRVLLPRDVFSFDLFVGVRSYPMLEGSNMLLKHGMLLSVCHRNTLVRTSSTQEHLFANRESWRSTERMPRESATGGICLITTGEDRWHFSSQDYPGFNFVEAVECCLGAAEGSIRISVLSSAAFEELCPLAEGTGSPFADLCLHGKHCNDVAIIVRDPPTGEAQGGREVSEECFLFLDLRPLGVRPHGMRQIGTVWSIPFGIPPGFEVHIEGGRIDGLLLYADSGTTVIASLVPAAPADVFAGIVATAASGDEQQDPDGGPAGHAQGPTHGIPPDSSGTRPRSRSRDRSLRPATTASGYTNALHLLAKGVSALFRSGCGILQALHFHAFTKKSAPVSSKLVPSIVAFQPVWESHTFGVLGQALEFGIGNLVLFSRLGKVQQAAHQCKVLQEPTGSSPAEVQHLAHLRDITLRLGGQRLQNGRLPFFVEGFDVDLDPDEVVSDADSDSGIHVGCVILKQGYSPEAFVVSLQLPCTVDEAEQVVQASRRAEDRRRFPTLTPIHPQPIAGNIAFAAAPEWAPLSSFQCLDTVSLDGRLWVRQVPDYVSRHEVLHIAGVPLTTACDMYAGLDFVLIDNENPFHVFPGCRIAITPSGQPALAPNSLGRLLCSREGWVPEARVPLARVLEDAYCVTVGQDSWLHFADPVRPMQYRRDIAARVGAPDGRIDIQAARPRPTNVELQGYRCRSVLAVSCRPRGASTNTGYHILVDGRPILEGWSTITLQQRYIHLDDLFEVLDVLSPPGWVPQLGLTSDGYGFVHLVAGQVIVAEFARSSDNTVDGPGSADHTGGSETSGVPTSSGPNRDSDGGPHAWQPFIAEEIDPVATSPDDHPEELVPFLIFAQEYWPELVVVPVVQPVNVHGVFASVANARQPAAHRRSPTLVAVFPQPCAQQACLLALPAWQYSGVGILIDCRVGSPRLFASIAPHFFTPDAILGLAGLHDARHLFVFHRDVPWPCPPGEQIFPEEGDVFTICPDPRRPWHYQDLGRLLASSSQWDCLPDLPGGEAGISWILSNGVHVAVPVASDNFAINNATVAESLDLTPGQFVVVPASPSITDHAHRGRSSQAVLFACTVEDYIPGGSNVRIPYILDLRPVLSRLLGMFAASGIVDIADIASFLLARCPAGHHLRLYGGSSQGDEGNHYRRVDPGEVITAEFQPDYLNVLPPNPAGSVIIRPPRAGGGESSHGDQGSERPSESSAASSRDAGTGGTRRSGPPRAHCFAADARHIVGLDAPGHDGQVFYLAHGIGGLTVTVRLAPFVFLAQVLGIVMWARSYLETCLVDGTCGVTPVFRRFSGRSFEFPASQLCTWLSCYWCRWHRVGIPEPLGPGGPWLLCCGACRHSFNVISSFIALGCRALFVSCATLLSQVRIQGSGGSFNRQVILVLVLLCLQARVCETVQVFGKTAIDRESGAIEDFVDAVRVDIVNFGSSAGAIDIGPIGDECHQEMHFPQRRALPTPCRSNTLPRVEDDFQVEVGCTLLEEAVCRQGDATYLETRVIIETLFEHFQDSLHAADSRPESCPADNACVISLAQSLPQCLLHDVTHVTMPSAIQVGSVAAVLGSSWIPEHVLPSGLSWHRATSNALGSLLSYEDGTSAGVGSLDIFTDGSFNGCSSSWAFAVIAHSTIGSFLFAWAKGAVALPGQDWHIGASEHSAVNGERSAVFWALSWLLGVHQSCPCTVHCDCLVAMYQASGVFGGTHDPGLAASCRSLAQTVEYTRHFGAASFQHVRGHCGHPYNELVDTLAGAIHLPDSPVPAHLLPLCKWACDGSINRLWLSVAALLEPQQWPHWQYGCFRDPIGNTTLHADGLAGSDFFGKQIEGGSGPDSEPSFFWVCTCFVTVNVQSLCEDDKSPLPNRVPFVRAQLEECGCAVAGLQETRVRDTATVLSDSHIRFTSARDSSGNLGVELWFSRKQPFGWAGSIPLHFDVQHFRVLSWSPRTLLVRFVHGSLRVLFVSCHAPTAAHPSRESWWKQFVDLLLLNAKGDRVVILGDLNSRLCQELPGRIGSHVWEAGAQPPEPFYRLLRCLDLWVPSTYPECHVGPSHTWIAPGGSAVSRIDFVLVPTQWWVPPEGSRVLYSVDFGQTGLDHFAARLRVDVRLRARLHFQGKALKFDVARACQPQSAAQVYAICATVPSVSWDTDAHRHYHEVSQHLMRGLVQQFPVARSVRRKPFISETTWSLRQQRVELRRQAHISSGALGRWELGCAFHSWRAAFPLTR